MNLEIARRQPQRRLRLVHGLVELGAGEQRLGQAVASPRQFGRHRQRAAIAVLGRIEQAGGPQRVAVQRDRVGIAGRGLHERVGLATRELEIGHAKRGGNHTGPRLTHRGRIVGSDSVAVGLERFRILTLVEQHATKPKLDVCSLREDLTVGMNHENRRRDEDRKRDEANAASHDSSSELNPLELPARLYKNRADPGALQNTEFERAWKQVFVR